MAIEFDGTSVPDGSSEWVTVPIATDADMSELDLRVRVITNGEGPTIWLQGGLHGSEHVGARALRDVLLDIDPADVSGTIVGVPVANPTAFANKQRLTGVDGRDVNRSFPGSQNGYFSEMLADRLYSLALEHADYFADFHNGGNEYEVAGFCIFSETGDDLEEESVAMCRAADLPYAVGVSSEFGGSMGTELIDEGIPSAVVEAGGLGHISPEYYEMNVHAIENIAKEVGVLNGEPTTDGEFSVHSGSDWHHASAGGFFEPNVDCNDEVSEGDELARITNVEGEVVETFVAQYDGILVCMRSYPMVRPGDWALQLTPQESA
ncbi:succinylglutamate desuccinylase/aspartoacylase family protein [Halovivax limisalsi]|uniref:succinylglutamate desuccinylase/aspartoacylase family protein n=1 Tax=Halovivax limisalsi TaxID=1453760 RepID=UPI001FFDD24F|nr:succinylglutamate desuccinylase/aspartoacylase family protein [Halovivax limisalsi]